ncbi:hypothetical protein F0562_020516 [Nyssa sinensis]|uniref:CCHC-type domain-containing protein n=1 Tax=Nyssa sinensis TaxID=561372 RepID=A0A5J5BSE0_9ASTE|nr:hypothetical protein F0562_020516 [Nyssa sinensis]
MARHGAQASGHIYRNSRIIVPEATKQGGGRGCGGGGVFADQWWLVFIGIILNMSSYSRSRSPMDRKIRTERYSHRNAPYRRESRQGFSQSNLCKNCKQPGHYARECPNVAICHNCGLPGHIASECTTKSLCWNCQEPGHMAGNCPNEGICHTCGKAGHHSRDCTAPPLRPGDLRLCNNCFKQGHMAAECTNDKACKNCRRTGHLARDCHNDPVCNLCNIAGHVARECPKGNVIEGRGAGARGAYRDIICRNCQQPGHMSRDCMGMGMGLGMGMGMGMGPLMICHNCGGRGHLSYQCPSERFMDRFPRSLAAEHLYFLVYNVVFSNSKPRMALGRTWPGEPYTEWRGLESLLMRKLANLNPPCRLRLLASTGVMAVTGISRSSSLTSNAIGGEFVVEGRVLIVPSYIVGESELETSKEDHSLKDFKYSCVGYSVHLDKKDPSTDPQEKQAELPFCVGIELLLDRRPSHANHVPAHVHKREDGNPIPQPRTYKPSHSPWDEFVSRYARNASVVALGVARNMIRVGNHIKSNLDDVMYPYRRRPKKKRIATVSRDVTT